MSILKTETVCLEDEQLTLSVYFSSPLHLESKPFFILDLSLQDFLLSPEYEGLFESLSSPSASLLSIALNPASLPSSSSHYTVLVSSTDPSFNSPLPRSPLSIRSRDSLPPSTRNSQSPLLYALTPQSSSSLPFLSKPSPRPQLPSSSEESLSSSSCKSSSLQRYLP